MDSYIPENSPAPPPPPPEYDFRVLYPSKWWDEFPSNAASLGVTVRLDGVQQSQPAEPGGTLPHTHLSSPPERGCLAIEYRRNNRDTPLEFRRLTNMCNSGEGMCL